VVVSDDQSPPGRPLGLEIIGQGLGDPADVLEGEIFGNNGAPAVGAEADGNGHRLHVQFQEAGVWTVFWRGPACWSNASSSFPSSVSTSIRRWAIRSSTSRCSSRRRRARW